MKVIETNMVMSEQHCSPTPIDIQSRVIEVDSWDSFVDEIKSKEQVTRKSVMGSAVGVSMPRSIKEVVKFKHNDRRLFCSFRKYNGGLMWKIAYLIQ